MVRTVTLLWMTWILAACGGPPINGAPTVTSSSFTLDQDTQLSATLTASDPENATVTFTKTGDPTHGQIVTFAANGAFTYRPTAGFVGTDSFAVSVSDGTNSVTATITLNVKANGGGGSNGAPTVTSASFTLDQDTQLSATLTASDPENATVTFTKTGDPTHGQIVTFAANGAFTYRPTAGFVGTDSFAVSVSDGTNSVTATITLNVKANSVLDPPGSGPTVTLGFALKQVTLAWQAVTDATFYRVLKNRDNHSGHAQVGADLTVTTYSDAIGVHVTDWVNASYIVQACNAGGCADSAKQFLMPADSSKAVGYFKASNTETGDFIGASVHLSGDGNTLAVSAFHEDSAVNDNQGDNAAPAAGAVYVFTRSGSTWAQQAYLKASNAQSQDYFGTSLSLSGDGNTLAVGATGEDSAAVGVNGDQTNNRASLAGAVYVFTRSGSTWSQQAYMKASNTGADDGFGQSLSLSGDGNTLAVGAVGEDSAATGVNGDQTNNTASFAGAVYVFTRSGTTWSQQAYVKASNTEDGDGFGRSLSLSGDGNMLAVGAYVEDSAATGVNGAQNDNTMLQAGAVYVFIRSGSTWAQQAYVKASNTESQDYFGEPLSLSADGNTLAVGATREDSVATGVNGDQTNNTASFAGAVYVFIRSGSTWAQQAYVKALNTGAGDGFGRSLSLSGDGNTLAVGANAENSAATGANGNQGDNTAPAAGAVYVFTRSASTWAQRSYVKASNTEAQDYFGTSLSLSRDGDTLAVGAPDESSAASGVNGDQSDNTTPQAGAVYLY